ncbi:hypothetical protein [Cellulomonas sp. KRMCY2]|uniref:hypothetical protein n=1 Tax=Cellulomonas sp. KRMCY2 TaxID=1304865 RepID=UPI0004B59B36|nr:hypothetical protein [Cellulomonas sp. KRMCY2]
MQIAESVAGRRRIVRHVGSAHDEAELGLLIQEANDLLVDDRQGVLDLGMRVPQRAASLLAVPSPPALFGDRSAQPRRRAVAAPTVLRTSSRLLFEGTARIVDDA